MNSKFARLRTALNSRCEKFPNHRVYMYIRNEAQAIADSLGDNGKLTSTDYDRVTIGIVCVRELEAEDEELCELVYKFVSSVRPDDYSIIDKYL